VAQAELALADVALNREHMQKVHASRLADLQNRAKLAKKQASDEVSRSNALPRRLLLVAPEAVPTIYLLAIFPLCPHCFAVRSS